MRVLVAGRLSRKVTDRDQTGFDSQEREAVRWAQERGHDVVDVVADYRSGRSGLDARPNLRPWVTDPGKLAQYDAIVALKVDRLTRGNREETTQLEQWAREHGKSLLIAGADVRFPSEGRDGIAWDLYLRMAHDEWVQISERYMRMLRERREQGSATGRAPWGFVTELQPDGTRRLPNGADGQKAFVPAPEGRKWVPLIYQAIIDGSSLRDVAAWLDLESVPHAGPWSEKSVDQLIKNPVYYGQRRNAGQLETEELVGYSVWQAANAALASRAKSGRNTVVRPKALLSPVCGNPGCDASGAHPSPMYRQYSKPSHPYYRCNGHGPRAHGCGNMLRADDLDSVVTETMLADRANFHVTRVFVAGDSRADDIGKLREQAADAYRRGDRAAFRELDTRADELESLPSVAPHWDEKASCETCGPVSVEQAWQCWREGHHVVTRGEHFASLGTDERRKYLAGYEIRACRDDVMIVPRWVVATP